jgi:hypothetical protein
MLRIFFHKYQRVIFFFRLLLYDVIYTTGGVLYLKLKWPLLLIYINIFVWRKIQLKFEIHKITMVNYMFLICCSEFRASSVSRCSLEKPCWNLVRGHSPQCVGWFLFLHRAFTRRVFTNVPVKQHNNYCICHGRF